MSYKYWKFEVEDGIGTLTINRPETLNALDIPSLLEMEKAIEEVIKDNSIRVLVITGAGDKAFIAGGDIADLNSRHAIAHRYEFAAVIHRIFNKVESMEKPTIAAINGYALGGGTELLCACDLRIASDNARIGVPEINLGIFPGSGGTQRLPLLVGPSKALEYMIFATKVPAAECLRVGLVDRLAKAGEVLQEAEKWAQALAKRPPLAVKGIIDCVNRGLGGYVEKGLEIECENYQVVIDSADCEEGLKAFSEKRAPNFKGE